MSLHPPHHSSTPFSFIRRNKVEKFLRELGVELCYNTTSTNRFRTGILVVFTVTMEMVAAGNSSCSSPPTTTGNNQVKSLISPLCFSYSQRQTQLGLTICSILRLRYVCWASWASSLVGFADPPRHPWQTSEQISKQCPCLSLSELRRQDLDDGRPSRCWRGRNLDWQTEQAPKGSLNRKWEYQSGGIWLSLWKSLVSALLPSSRA